MLFTTKFLVGQTENKWEDENAKRDAHDHGESDPLTLMLQEEEMIVAKEGTLDEVMEYMNL